MSGQGFFQCRCFNKSESVEKRKRISTQSNTDVGQDSFFILPNELLTQIFGHLPKEATTLNHIRQVSRRFKDCLEENDDLWRIAYEYKFHNAYKGSNPQLTWFHRYQYKSKLQRAWSHSKYHQLTLGNPPDSINSQIDGHFGCVCCVRFDKTRILTCSEDKSIKVWDYNSGKCIRSYTGHTEAVWSVRSDKDILASAGGDKVIKLWDLNKHKLLRTLEGHRAECWCVDINVNQNRVVSGSVDSTVGIYDLETGTRLHLLTHHTSSVFGLQLYENSLVTGSKDGTAYLFDMRDPQKYVHQYSSCGSAIFCLQMDTNKLVTGHGNGIVNIYDIMTTKSLHQYRYHSDSIWSLHFDEDHLVTGSADKTIRVQKWSKTETCEDMYGWRNIGTIFSVMLNEDKIMVGDSSGCVQVLDYNNEFPKSWGNGGSGARLRENKAPLPDNNIQKFDEQGKLNYSVF